MTVFNTEFHLQLTGSLRYSKGALTQHQFILESVNKSPDFPCGVKMTYRKYSSDEVMEVRKDDTLDTKTKLTDVKVIVKTYPAEKQAENGNPYRPAGLSSMSYRESS